MIDNQTLSLQTREALIVAVGRELVGRVEAETAANLLSQEFSALSAEHAKLKAAYDDLQAAATPAEEPPTA